MWPPRLLDDRPQSQQFFIAFVLPLLFGCLCGYLLGESKGWYTALTTLGILGGINAGYEHIGAGDGVRRGLIGGILFASGIVLVHALSGDSPAFKLPAKLGVLAVIYALLGAAFGALGGWLRERRERRSGAAPAVD